MRACCTLHIEFDSYLPLRRNCGARAYRLHRWCLRKLGLPGDHRRWHMRYTGFDRSNGYGIRQRRHFLHIGAARPKWPRPHPSGHGWRRNRCRQGRWHPNEAPPPALAARRSPLPSTECTQDVSYGLVRPEANKVAIDRGVPVHHARETVVVSVFSRISFAAQAC